MNKPVRPNELYDADYHAWTVQQVEALRRGDASALDYENLAEEVQDLGDSKKDAIESDLEIILTHLLKWRHQPDKRKLGWLLSIAEHRRRIAKIVRKNPSLARYPANVIEEEYEAARDKASRETGLPPTDFPEACPFAVAQVLDREFLPDGDMLTEAAAMLRAARSRRR